MNIENTRGRHRAPGRHNPLIELKLLARESAQPAMKAGAVVAATGGLVATFANPASADTLKPASGNVAAAASADSAAPAAVGPATAAAPAASSALSKIGFAPEAQQAVAQRVSTSKPEVIEDVQVQAQRAAAKAAAVKAAAERKAAAARASRDLTRRTLTSSTSSAKASFNGSVPGASAGMRASSNWATAGQCTWGALNKWYQSEGYYPGGWTGNAMAWASGARSAGYTVSTAPRTRSIIVLQPGVAGSSSVGHVGWVTAVNGNQVTMIEMNATAGAYNYDTRTVTLSGGMSFIYAP
ncbi:CHAP domain-containing protein [Terrabacter carboxydivorans]|uniref:Peptidase C51 domain-containing protein n=1 Tax=Terrabacter carboxydivorans TaxID=619730 RepID=A0ABP5Y372_9MICO